MPGQSVTIGLRLTPAGTVTGKISDSSGEPLAGITVQLLRSKYDSKGKRSFQAEATARTDDHGSYRFYWMTPGRYYVKASTARIDSDSLAPRNGNVFVDPGYVPTFYPGTNDLSAALPIEVQAGTEMSAVDLNLLRQPLYTIKGRVRNSTTGDTPIYVNVALFPRGSSDGLVMGYGGAPYDGKTGRFEFHDVAPGSYWAQATLLQGGFGRPERNVAFEPVDVSFRPGITIKGRLSLSVDPRSTRILPADFERIHVVLEPLTSDIFGTPQATVKNDGSFLIENVAPGEYRLTISGIPPNTYVKEAGLGRLDLLQRFTIREEASDAAEIVISTRSGELSGIVTGRDGMAVPGAFVVLVPELSRDQHLLFKTAMSDQNGAYLLRGLAPGDYRLFVWEEIEPFSYYDPSVLRQYDKFGAPVHIMESITATATTEIIPKK